jgi:hypothetical protein
VSIFAYPEISKKGVVNYLTALYVPSQEKDPPEHRSPLLVKRINQNSPDEPELGADDRDFPRRP